MEGFVEIEAEVSEDDPELLPSVRVLELPDGGNVDDDGDGNGADDGNNGDGDDNDDNDGGDDGDNGDGGDDDGDYNDNGNYDENRPQQITGQLVLKSSLVVDDRHAESYL